MDTGLVGAGSIGDLVWIDRDRDGTRDQAESGAAGVTVSVSWLGPDGVAGGGDDALFAVVTDAAGRYLVDGLPAGRYTVRIDATTLPDGTSAGSDLDGGDPTGTVLDLAAGQLRDDVDFALHVPPAQAAASLLARTGAEIREPLVLGGLALVTGFVLLLVGRRRRTG